MRIGVMGGTFDPIHIGHLVAAEEARCALRLEKVLFVPAGEPAHKEPGDVSLALHRVRMVGLAVATNSFFELSTVDVARPGKSYTVDTVTRLRRQMGEEADLFFIVGMDSLGELTTWKEPDKLVSLCRLAVVNRPPYRLMDLAILEQQIPGISDRVDLVKMPGIDISASDLRLRVATGLPVKYLVPEPVEQYIKEKGLYRDLGTRP